MSREKAPFNLDEIVEIIADALLRRVLGFPYNIDKLSRPIREVAEEVIEEYKDSLILADENSIIRCKLCSKGPFTKKGFYLHAKRIHMETLKSIIREKLETMLWQKAMRL